MLACLLASASARPNLIGSTAAAPLPLQRLTIPAQWSAASGSPPPTGSRNQILFDCPFPAGADRHVWDVSVDRLDLSRFTGIEIDYSLQAPEAFRGITWYARSGNGWYAAALPVTEGRQRIWLPFQAFEELDRPSGWDRISGFRLSPWTAQRGSGSMILHSVVPRSAQIAIVPPSERSVPDAAERAFGRRNADQWATDLAALGQPAALLEEANIHRRSLADYQVVILPYNPQLPGSTVRALRSFVEQGGHLILSYNAHPELAALVGVRVDRWITAEPAGRWHQMAFDHLPDWQGPRVVIQAGTPHLLPVRPAADDAHILAEWQNAAGRRQREAALVASPRGAWFSYLLGADDEPRRRRMIAFLMDRYLPGTALTAARRRIADLEETVPADDSPTRSAVDRARSAAQSDDPAAAWAAVDDIADFMRQQAAASKDWPRHLPLGIWDHSGRGLHDGDWPQTIGQLQEAGFTDVFVYVPRTARRPTRAVAAGSEAGLSIHAWHICFKVAELPIAERRRLERRGLLQESTTGNVAPWLCPSLPENRQHELDRLLELAGTPGLRGIHLDYIRYPDEHHCYGQTCRDGFEEETGRRITPWPAAVRDGNERDAFLRWRAEQISIFMQEAARAIREAHPDLMISVAVWPDVRTVASQLGQDWPRWLAEGWVDMVAPMSYTASTGELAAWTRSHTELEGADNRIWAGLGVTSSHTRLTPQQTLQQGQAAADAGASGLIVFDLNTTVQSELFPVLKAIQSNPSDE